MKKHRQCPHCKSKKGFKISYNIKGYGHEDRDFKGNVLDSEKTQVTDSSNYASCLNCDKLIDSYKLEIE